MKIGLFGFGHLGKIHFKCLKQCSFELVGIYDPLYVGKADCDDVPFYSSEEELMESIDACVIASETSSHFGLTKLAIKNKVHFFVEKPMTKTLNQANKLIKLLDQNPNLITMVGFVERYNPTFKYLKPHIKSPRFLEVHRLTTFTNRGLDVSVVFDLMIHDLDLILNIKKEEIIDIKASGVKLLTDSLDICNVRLEFSDFSVANITASRMSMKNMRKFRIFQKNAYLSMDLNKKEAQIVNLTDEQVEESMRVPSEEIEKYFTVKSSGTLEGNAILDELNVFYNAIVNNKQTESCVRNALKTTKLADEIETIALQSASIA
ncbi:MAG: Gfo/Idh/MocA family oxidoreductase [Saprospiraceae bacterium]|nr:Gfo/Idh/MocA family oxidoreductase [Bacteroidia bacterium]NNE14414.1 Gfo/Idh/MocA family oxidoreductase [Saprospiraceae bacterium]NNL91690.1 Gfo/Idh/MocA family oxidoreductase [Saprospiraceae bacterium]